MEGREIYTVEPGSIRLAARGKLFFRVCPGISDNVNGDPTKKRKNIGQTGGQVISR